MPRVARSDADAAPGAELASVLDNDDIHGRVVHGPEQFELGQLGSVRDLGRLLQCEESPSNRGTDEHEGQGGVRLY